MGVDRSSQRCVEKSIRSNEGVGALRLVTHTEVNDRAETVLTVVGEVDAHAVARLRNQVCDDTANPDVLDLRFVPLLGAAGITWILELHARHRLRIEGSVTVLRVLAICGLDDELQARAPSAPPALHAAPFGVAVHDTELRYLYVNEVLAEINGLAGPAHVGHRPAELFSFGDDPIGAILHEVVATQTSTTLDLRGTTAAGVLSSWSCGYWPVRYREGDRDVTGVVAVVAPRPSTGHQAFPLSFDLAEQRAG